MYGFGYRYSTKEIYVPSGGGLALDRDAQAFITAAEIKDPIEQSAVNQLVVDMKDARIWTKMKAVYPFVGGTATSHKWNLINPVDSDAAFRLVFNGGWTHSASGALPNGTNGYANTFFNTDDVTSTGLQSFGVYLRNAPTFAVSVTEYPTGLRNGIYHIRVDSTASTSTNFRSGSRSEVATGNTGFLAQSRSSTTEWYSINNSTLTTLTNLASTLSVETTYAFALGAYKNLSSVQLFSTQELAFAFYAEPLLTTEMSDFNTAIATFQTTLSRNV